MNALSGPLARVRSLPGNRLLIIGLAIPFTLLALLAGWLYADRVERLHARTRWKTETLPRLAALSVTNKAVLEELTNLREGVASTTQPWWTGEQVLMMTNGEYLIYASRHGYNAGWVDHLLLARGSDGRWWYSTYHFCNSMAGVAADVPPGSIKEFAERYAAREFDGRSDVCLQHTWPAKESPR